jgi:acetyl esterase/lipase
MKDGPRTRGRPPAAMPSQRIFRRSQTAILLAVLFALAGCRASLFLAANIPSDFAHESRHLDLPYGDDARQRLDVYSPLGLQDRPVVVFWYGGSWIEGNKRDYRFVAAPLVEHGFVVVIPDYRLYPEVTFPKFDEDGAAALRWVEEHISQYGGDPSRLVLMGHSAGGHTAAFLAYNRALLERFDVDPTRIKGLVGLSGTYAFVPDSDVLREAFPSPPYSNADWQPIQFVDERSPPTLLLHGLSDHEVRPEEALQLRERLQQKHVPVTLKLYAHRGHRATVAPFAWVARWSAPVVKQVLRFIEDVTRSGSE